MAAKKKPSRSVRIKAGDTVQVIAGDDRGARGAVLNVYPRRNKVVVAQVNIVKKHQRPVQAGRSGQVQAGIIQFEAPFQLSNVMVVCPSCDDASRVGIRREDGNRIRVCKKCGEDID